MEILKRDAEQAEVCRTVYGYFDSNQIAVDESKQALAKVSELVEADRGYDEALRVFNNMNPIRPDWSHVYNMWEAAQNRRAAALSAVMEG